MDLLDLNSSSEAAPPVVQQPVEDDKCTVFVEHDGQTYTVSWYRGTSAQDVTEAIVCACDSIIDSGFTLIGADGFPCAIETLQNLQHYSLVAGAELPGFEKVLGDRWRKVNVQIPALEHVEARKALDLMLDGTNMLKYTVHGPPHIRMFQLTSDWQNFIWYTASKDQKDSSVHIPSILSIQLGQNTEVFQAYPIPSLAHLSFSIICPIRTVDLICKDEREYDFWVTGLKALIFHFKQLPVNKQILLNHSRRFLEYLGKNKIGQSSEAISHSTDTKRLEDYIVRKPLAKEDVTRKLVRNRSKLATLQEKAALCLQENPYVKRAPPANSHEYVELILDDEGYDEILNTHQDKLRELLRECTSALVALETEFEMRYSSPDIDNTTFENSMWKLEIDLENASDIISRWERTKAPTVTDRVKSWFKGTFSF